ncbi:MAG: hypothetical protein R3F41_12535 [Gammaproteobacteria bacterium]|nr:hypothetical protein [Pseudomonadales bacterium]MCP5348924.1 hypothetical protein [Pseudomonadales bacterium]
MYKKPIFTRVARTLGAPTIALFLAGTLAVNANAQDPLTAEYPEVAKLLDAFDITEAAMFDKLVAINSDPATRIARNQLELHFIEMASMDDMGHGGHGGGHSGHDMEMLAGGAYGEQETAARAELFQMLRANHSEEEVQNAYLNSGAINRHTAMVLTRGRQLRDRLFEIYVDDSVTNKLRAVNAAIDDYLSDERHSVSPVAKEFSLVGDNPQATAFATAFPKLSALQWANRWATLAALESIMIEYSDTQFRNTMNTVLERYWNKVGSEGGMTMFPAPAEQPTAAAIAPHLYSFHPRASIILDNLGRLESIIFDVLSYPNLDNREELIGTAVSEYTNKETHLSQDYDYLLAALRGGIYNQGGPAVGDLERSERNRSRDEMGHMHTAIMSSPQ